MQIAPRHFGKYHVSLFLLTLIIIAIVILTSHQRSEVVSSDSWIQQWKAVSSLNQARRALAAATDKHFLYAIGGISDNNQVLASIEFSKILPNGDLSPWQMTISLPQARIYAAAVVVDHYLYVIGGGIGAAGSSNQPTEKVIRARILANGSLQAWQSSSSLSSARRGLKVFAHQNKIYAVGGYDGRFLKSTEYASIQPYTGLTPWEISTNEAHLERYIHAAAHSKNTLYVLGGHQHQVGTMTNGDVESTRINGDGTLNPWFIEKARLNKPRFIAAAFALNKYLYILGGHNGGNRLKSVEFAPIFTDGHIGQFELTSPLGTERSASEIAVAGNRVYIIGGMSNYGTLAQVEMAKASKNGHLGHND